MASAEQQVDAELRPGERREPVLVTLAEAELSLFIRECGAADASWVYPLLIERRLLLDDVATAGMAPAFAIEWLDAAAARARVTAALDGPSTDYLRRFLGRQKSNRELTRRFLAPVPVRIYARAVEARSEVIEHGAVDQALRWERASVSAGRTMAEWAFLVLLGSELPTAD